MANDIEATKRANVEGLNKAAVRHVKITKGEEDKVREWTRAFIDVVFGRGEEKMMEEESKELYIALLEDDDKKIEENLLSYVHGMEYNWATDGGEPDLLDILAIKLIEKIKGQKYYASMIYTDRYLEHVGILSSSKVKEDKEH